MPAHKSDMVPLAVSRVLVLDFPIGRKTAIPYTQRGDGPKCLVFIHGIFGSRGDFDAMLTPPSEWTFITLDRPGHGSSPFIDGPEDFEHTVLSDAELIRMFCEKLNIERSYFFGMSYGGSVVLTLAILFPELVAGCALQGAQEDGAELIQHSRGIHLFAKLLLEHRRSFALKALSFYYRKRCAQVEWSEESLKLFYGLMMNPHEDVLLRAMPNLTRLCALNIRHTNKAVAAENLISIIELKLSDGLRNIKAPCIVIDGEHPHPALQSANRIVTKLSDNVPKEICILPDVGHLASFFAHEEIRRRVIQFFERHTM